MSARYPPQATDVSDLLKQVKATNPDVPAASSYFENAVLIVKQAKNQRLEAVMVLGTPILFPHQRRIAELATAARLPTISPWREFPEAGGLLSDGANLRGMFRRVAEVLDHILKGTKPSDIPLERPTKFDLVVNDKAAKALGLARSRSLLLRADEVIRSLMTRHPIPQSSHFHGHASNDRGAAGRRTSGWAARGNYL